MARSRGVREEGGFAMVIVALVLVLLMVFAAFVVDLGQVFSARRQDQNAADAGALAAAQDVITAPGSIVTDVDTYVSDTLGIATGTINWSTGCPGSNSDQDNVDTAVSGTTQDSSCITRDTAGRIIQVRLPDRTVPSVFGKVIGISSYTHTAFAIAGLLKSGFGSVLPYALSAGAGSSDGYVCLKTGASGHTGDPTCDGATTGNFGYVDFAYFGSSDLNTPTDCSNGNQRTRNINSTAAGIDHDLSKFNGSPYNGAAVIDTDTPCASRPTPNSMYVLTGNTPQDFGTGMYSGSSVNFTDGQPARLQRSSPLLFSGTVPTGVQAQTKVIATYSLDSNPLWNFITPGLKSNGVSGGSDDVPQSCQRDQFVGTDGVINTADDLDHLPPAVAAHFPASVSVADRTRALLKRCLDQYQAPGGVTSWNDGGSLTPADPRVGCSGTSPCTGVVFGLNSSTTDVPDLYDIQYTSRFGYVPQLTSDFPTGNQAVHIATFRAIWLQRLLAGQCTASSGCDHSFDPGVPYTGSSGSATSADGITAYVFPTTILPNGLAGETAPFDIGKNRFIRLIR